jgi:hypothetical protein
VRRTDAAAGLLSSALAEGQLTAGEHAERVGAAYSARTLGELGALTADLPAPARNAAGPETAAVHGEVDRCLLCALLILCPPAGIAWLLTARRRARAAYGRAPAGPVASAGSAQALRPAAEPTRPWREYQEAAVALHPSWPAAETLTRGGPGAENR